MVTTKFINDLEMTVYTPYRLRDDYDISVPLLTQHDQQPGPVESEDPDTTDERVYHPPNVVGGDLRTVVDSVGVMGEVAPEEDFIYLAEIVPRGMIGRALIGVALASVVVDGLPLATPVTRKAVICGVLGAVLVANAEAVVETFTVQAPRLLAWWRNRRVTTLEDRLEIDQRLDDSEDVESYDEDFNEPYPYAGVVSEESDSHVVVIDETEPCGTETTAVLESAKEAEPRRRDRRLLRKKFWTWVLNQVRSRFCTVGPPVRDAATEKAIALFVRRVCDDRGVRPSHINMIIPWVIELTFVPTKNQLRAQEVATHPTVTARKATQAQRITHHQTFQEWLTSFVHIRRGRSEYRE